MRKVLLYEWRGDKKKSKLFLWRWWVTVNRSNNYHCLLIYMIYIHSETGCVFFMYAQMHVYVCVGEESLQRWNLYNVDFITRASDCHFLLGVLMIYSKLCSQLQVLYACMCVCLCVCVLISVNVHTSMTMSACVSDISLLEITTDHYTEAEGQQNLGFSFFFLCRYLKNVDPHIDWHSVVQDLLNNWKKYMHARKTDEYKENVTAN